MDPYTEQRIHELIERAAQLMVSFRSNLLTAQKAFARFHTSEVMKYFPHDRDCVVISNKEMGDRLGAHYHSNVYRRLENTIRDTKYADLRDLSSEIFAPPPFKHIYLPTPNQFPFVTGGELVNHRFTDVKYLSHYGVKNIQDYVVKEGWLAIYKSGQLDSMLGTTFYVSKQLDGFCLSDHIIRVVVNQTKIHPAYVFAFLSTWIGRLLVIRRAMGKSVPFVREETVASIPIPLLDDQTIETIVTLITEGFRHKMASLTLEDEAQILLAEALNIG